jgi:hypothetical protein
MRRCSNTAGSFACACIQGLEDESGSGTNCTLPLRAYMTTSVSPPQCSSNGGDVVRFTLHAAPILPANTSLFVMFPNNATAEAHAVSGSSGLTWEFTCPAYSQHGALVPNVLALPRSAPVVSADKARNVSTLLHTATSRDLISSFVLSFRAPNAVLSPPYVPLSGGAVSIRVFLPPAGPLTRCTFSVGGIAAPVVSYPSGLPQVPINATSRTSAVFVIKAPAVASPGSARVAMSCGGRGFLGASLQYLPAPYVHVPGANGSVAAGSSDIFESERCLVTSCVLVVSIKSPPPWVVGVEHLNVSVQGDVAWANHRGSESSMPIIQQMVRISRLCACMRTKRASMYKCVALFMVRFRLGN